MIPVIQLLSIEVLFNAENMSKSVSAMRNMFDSPVHWLSMWPSWYPLVTPKWQRSLIKPGHYYGVRQIMSGVQGYFEPEGKASRRLYSCCVRQAFNEREPNAEECVQPSHAMDKHFAFLSGRNRKLYICIVFPFPFDLYIIV